LAEVAETERLRLKAERSLAERERLNELLMRAFAAGGSIGDGL
jgi:hypothetical protein